MNNKQLTSFVLQDTLISNFYVLYLHNMKCVISNWMV